MGLVTASLLSGPVRVDVIAVIAMASGLVNGIRTAAVIPALRRIVPREQFAARAAQEQGMAMATQLAGSPLAALLFTAARWLPFGVDALSYVFSTIAAILIRKDLGPDRREAEGNAERPSVLTDVKAGFRLIRTHPFLRYTTSWVAVTNLVGNSFMLLMIALLQSRGASPEVIGVTNAGVLAGGILGALLAGRIVRLMPALRVFQLGGWIYVFSLTLAAIAPSPWQIGLAAAAFTFASVPTVTVWEAYTVRLVPDGLTGRVLSASAFCSQSLTWIGMLGAGWMANEWGALPAALCFAGLLVPFAVAGHISTSIALFRRPLDDVQELPERA